MKNIKSLFPNASPSFLKLNGLPDDVPTPSPKPKRAVRSKPLGATKVKKRDSSFYVVRIKSFRVRLLDTDNLIPKWHVDALRYAGIIPDDSPELADITTTQEKVATKAEERTEIEITRHLERPAL